MSEASGMFDDGGIHARLVSAEVAGGRVPTVGPETTLHTRDHASFQTAWQEFGRRQGGALPRAVAIAIAGPTRGEIIRFTNNPWIIRRSEEHTSELQSLMRISYAVFCLKKKNTTNQHKKNHEHQK